MSLMVAPKYFDLRKTEKGTVLVEEGIYKKTTSSEKYPNSKQNHFLDKADGKLKVVNGGTLYAIVKNNDLNVNSASKPVKITYQGEETIESGDYKGNTAHQFDVDPVGWDVMDVDDAPAATTPVSSNLDDLE